MMEIADGLTPQHFKRSKNQLTEQERANLAKKLDDDLEKFMEEMAAKKAAENTEKKPFDFDQWCKEIDEHPAFMTDINAGLNGKYADTIRALQAMKYDEDDAEDKQLNAERHKEEGNKHFKLQKYRWATDCYTNGIKEKCLDRKLNSVLYSNRAAAQKHIGNLRSAIKDCTISRKFDPENLKGVIRCSECLLELGYGKESVEWIESSKRAFAVSKELSENGTLGGIAENEQKQLDSLEVLKAKSLDVVRIEERNERRNRVKENKENEEKRRLLKALRDRHLNLQPRLPFENPELMDWSLLEVSLPQLKEHQRVCFDNEDNLQWPLLVQYPEVGQLDVLTECCESTHLGTLMNEILASPAEWDEGHKFRFENVRFFVSDQWDDYLMEVFEWNDFRSIFSLPGYRIKRGLPVIMRNSRIAAVSRLSDMKRSSCSENGNEGVNDSNGHSDPPPNKRPLSGSEDTYHLEKMGINGITHDDNIEKVIDRRVREANVLSEMFPLKTKANEILSKGNFKAIIISGGPKSVYAEGSPQVDPEIFSCGIPVLGICYGFQVCVCHLESSIFFILLLNKGHGGGVTKEQVREDGQCSIYIDTTSQLFQDSTVCAALLHRALGADRITAIHIDNGFMRQNESDSVIESLNAINLQVLRYNSGQDFLMGTVSGNRGDGPMLDKTVDPETKRQIIGNTFIRVKDDVMDKVVLNFCFRVIKGVDVIFQLKLNKDEYFLAQGTLRPDLIESASTLASGHADTIKTHHNDTALVRDLRAANFVSDIFILCYFKGRVIEPLKDFHKDEVRELGQSLGLPEDLVQRQPFPGPGLAIRILCSEEYKNKVKYSIVSAFYSILCIYFFSSYSYVAALSTSHRPIPWPLLARYANIIPKLLHNVNRKVDGTRDVEMDDLGRKVQQMPVVMIPVHFDRSPAEPNSYMHSFVLRPFITADFMTGIAALPGRDIPEKNVLEMADRILSHVIGSSRVMIDLTSKPPGTTEWE
uniref:GMP synthase (glutamine-hydrolyzing) n=1 Tax=Heterorhabditis bacteriophora TaxID=37862 RepID=A0A1I7XT64_HETBA